MKIENKGFRITDICPQMSSIEVDSEGMVSVHAAETPGAMTREQFDALFEAMEVVRDRLDNEPVSSKQATAFTIPRTMRDRTGDAWTNVHGHIYTMYPDQHANCNPKDCRDGIPLEDLKRDWGPLTILS